MCVCVCVCAVVHMLALACMWWSEDNMGESGLSFYHVSPGDKIQLIQFGCKHLYLLSHLACPEIYGLKQRPALPWHVRHEKTHMTFWLWSDWVTSVPVTSPFPHQLWLLHTCALGTLQSFTVTRYQDDSVQWITCTTDWFQTENIRKRLGVSLSCHLLLLFFKQYSVTIIYKACPCLAQYR